jgi:hypothetical protein
VLVIAIKRDILLHPKRPSHRGVVPLYGARRATLVVDALTLGLSFAYNRVEEDEIP